MKRFNQTFFVFLVSLFFFNGVVKADVAPATHYNAQGQIDYIEYFDGDSQTPTRTEKYIYSGSSNLAWIAEYRGSHGDFNLARGSEFYMLSQRGYYTSIDESGNFTIRLTDKYLFYDGQIDSPSTVYKYDHIKGEDIVVKRFDIAKDGRASHSIEYLYDRIPGTFVGIVETDYRDNNIIVRKVETWYGSYFGKLADTRVYRVIHYGTVFPSSSPFSEAARVEIYHYADDPSIGILLNGHDYAVVDYRPTGASGIDPEDPLKGTNDVLISYYSHIIDSQGEKFYFHQEVNRLKSIGTLLEKSHYQALPDHRVVPVTSIEYDLSGKDHKITRYDSSGRTKSTQTYLYNSSGKQFTQSIKNISYAGDKKSSESTREYELISGEKSTHPTHYFSQQFGSNGEVTKSKETTTTYHPNGKVATYEDKAINTNGQSTHTKQYFNESGILEKIEDYDTQTGKLIQTRTPVPYTPKHAMDFFGSMHADEEFIITKAIEQPLPAGVVMVGQMAGNSNKRETK